MQHLEVSGALRLLYGSLGVKGSRDLLNTVKVKVKGKVHPCTGIEALYRPYGP